jgi:pimeloyl-ACP methyl ester carboxylesterase
VTTVTEAVGKENIRAFWLAGHSQGGLTSRRLVCTEFFESKVDGFASLSGGRLGGAPQRSPNAGRPRQADAPAPAAPAPATAATTPAALATRYIFSARVRRDYVVDTEAGKTYDSRSQNPGTREWGLLPRLGTAEAYEYHGCDEGRVIADVVRLDKGHTEGFEPNIMDTIVSMMVSA